MSEKQEYPARGKMSADGKYYTHADGSVHVEVRGECAPGECGSNECSDCSVAAKDGRCRADCTFETHYEIVEGAYVQTDEEREACDMARKMIEICCQAAYASDDTCNGCAYLDDQDCPARAYLAKHGDATAWEVKT